MADGPSAEDATANELGDSDTRVTRERHKRLDANTPIAGFFSATTQDAAKHVLENVSTFYEVDNHRRPHHDRRFHEYHRHQQHFSRRSYHHQKLSLNHNHYYYNNPRRHHLTNHRNNERVINDDDGDDGNSSSNSGGGGGSSGGGGGSGGGGSNGGGGATTTTGGGDSTSCVDAIRAASDDDKSCIGVEARSGSSDGVGVNGSGSGDSGGDGSSSGNGSGSDSLHHDHVSGIEIVGSVVDEVDDDRSGGGGDDDDQDDDDDDNDDDYDEDEDEDDVVDSDCGGDSGGSSNSNISKSGVGGAAIMTGRNNNATTRSVGISVGIVENADATESTSSSSRRTGMDGVPEVNDRGANDAAAAAMSRMKRASVVVVREPALEQQMEQTRANVKDGGDAATPKTDDDGDDDGSDGGGGGSGVPAAIIRHQGSPFKGQVRMAEDTLVGPCGKKRCADRYDSSESSDREFSRGSNAILEPRAIAKAPEGEGCPRCGGYVYAAEQMLARGRQWHKECFKCANCSKRLDSINCCEGPDKDIYCKVCYGKRFGPKGYGYGQGGGALQSDCYANGDAAPRTTVIDTAAIKAPPGKGCPRCGGVVFAAEQVLAKGREWHRKCYKCRDCTKTLDSIIACDGPDRDVYCKTCYGKKWGPHGYGFACGSGFLQTDGLTEEEISASRPFYNPDTTSIKAPAGQGCPRCGGMVFAAEQQLAKGTMWHKKCFNCAECHRPLDSMLACDGPDKEIHCRACYGKLFGPKGFGFGHRPTLVSTNGDTAPSYIDAKPQVGQKRNDGHGCSRCGYPVYAAEQMISKNRVWHKRCFSCGECHRSLDSTNLNDGPDGDIYCRGCYSRNFGPKGVGFGIGAGTLTMA